MRRRAAKCVLWLWLGFALGFAHVPRKPRPTSARMEDYLWQQLDEHLEYMTQVKILLATWDRH